MQTILQIFTATQTINKSKFIAYFAPFCEFQRLLKQLRNENPKAAHIVWAYRSVNKFGQIVENLSDDGEPKGSSAAPILAVLRGVCAVEICCLVVRYFGGIKLGVGGLVRAYSSSANLCVNECKNALGFKLFKQKDEMQIFVPFALVARLEHFLSTNFCGPNFLDKINFKTEFTQNGAKFQIFVSKDEAREILRFLHSFKSADFEILALPIFTKNLD